MKVVRKGESPESVANTPLFTGLVHTSPLVTTDESQTVGVTLVRFFDGGRNKFHTHTADQILYVTEGRGIVASKDHEHHVTEGDIVHVPAGELHWHGAEPGADIAHLSILPASQTAMPE